MAIEHTCIEHSSFICLKIKNFVKVLGHFNGSQWLLQCFSWGSGGRRAIDERRGKWREQNGLLDLAWASWFRGEWEQSHFSSESVWELGLKSELDTFRAVEKEAQHPLSTRGILGRTARLAHRYAGFNCIWFQMNNEFSFRIVLFQTLHEK